MQKETELNKETSLFSAERIDDVITMKFKEDFLFHTTDFKTRDEILAYIDLVSGINLVKVMVIIGYPEKGGFESYIEFYKRILVSKLGLTAIQRMYNIVDQLIYAIVNLNKIVINLNSGKVISLFQNISLACDYRIIAENTVFQNPFLELGTIPKGGGAFFLSKMLGVSKAYKILLSGKNITAYEALELGIVDKVVPLNELEESGRVAANWFAKKPLRTLQGVKRLLNHSKGNLKENLEIENEEILRTINDTNFWKTVYEENTHFPGNS